MKSNSLLSMVRKKRSLVLAVFGFLGSFLSIQAQVDGTARENQVKAAYLYNFTRFVTWEHPLPASPDKLVVGFIGAGGIADVLEAFLASSGNNQKVTVKKLKPDSPDIGNCHILFIEPAIINPLESILKRIEGKPILTVGNEPNFIKNGGMVGLYEENGRIKIRLDLARAEAANLKISSKLIEVATLVEPEEK